MRIAIDVRIPMGHRLELVTVYELFGRLDSARKLLATQITEALIEAVKSHPRKGLDVPAFRLTKESVKLTLIPVSADEVSVDIGASADILDYMGDGLNGSALEAILLPIREYYQIEGYVTTYFNKR